VTGDKDLRKASLVKRALIYQSANATAPDDLDGGTDTPAGYRSLLRGIRPTLRGVASWQVELDLIVSQLQAWSTAGASLAVCVLTRQMVNDVLEWLSLAAIPAAEIGPDGPRSPTAYTWARCTDSRAWSTSGW